MYAIRSKQVQTKFKSPQNFTKPLKERQNCWCHSSPSFILETCENMLRVLISQLHLPQLLCPPCMELQILIIKWNVQDIITGGCKSDSCFEFHEKKSLWHCYTHDEHAFRSSFRSEPFRPRKSENCLLRFLNYTLRSPWYLADKIFEIGSCGKNAFYPSEWDFSIELRRPDYPGQSQS